MGDHGPWQGAEATDVMDVPTWDGPPLAAPPLWPAAGARARDAAYWQARDGEGTMALMPTLPASRPLTLEDFEAIRDVEDGHRYELIDGALIVTPSPVPVHQRVLTRLWKLLSETAPPDHEVFVAPLDIRLAGDTVVQPDILAAEAACIGSTRIQGAPVLAVEVLSPSTRHIDLSLKRARYEEAGCPNYWVIDPEEPSLRAWVLGPDGYALVSHEVDASPAELDRPWPVRVTPADLTRS